MGELGLEPVRPVQRGTAMSDRAGLGPQALLRCCPPALGCWPQCCWLRAAEQVGEAEMRVQAAVGTALVRQGEAWGCFAEATVMSWQGAWAAESRLPSPHPAGQAVLQLHQT